MGNILDLLLSSDFTNVKKPSKEVEIKRLSEILKQKVVFRCEAVSVDTMAYINNSISDENSATDARILTVIEGVKEPSLKDKTLLQKFNALNAKELLTKKEFLLPGEIMQLYEIINDLSGFNEGAVEEIKNLLGQTGEQT